MRLVVSPLRIVIYVVVPQEAFLWGPAWDDFWWFYNRLATCRGLKLPGVSADTYAMSMIDGIASMSTALSQLQLQTEVSTRVLKMAQGQGQVSAQLLNAAMENVQEVISEMAEGLGDGVDIYG